MSIALNGGLEIEQGEQVLLQIAPDRGRYWRGHLVMAVIGGVLAGVVLAFMGDPNPWVGPIAAIAALLVRGWYLASETLALRWQLTDRRLVLPHGRAYRLVDITKARPFLGDVQIITAQGDKHLIKYPANPSELTAAIVRAQAGGKPRPEERRA